MERLSPQKSVAAEEPNNPFKKSGLRKIVIGDPYSPDSGNWIYVTAEQDVKCRGPGGVEAVTTINHRFRVQRFEDVLPTLLDLSNRYKDAGK